jgi:hypothetical protein
MGPGVRRDDAERDADNYFRFDFQTATCSVVVAWLDRAMQYSREADA